MKRAATTKARDADQAEGLRQMFGRRPLRFVPVVSNPHIAFGGIILERLTTAWGEHGAATLVVDAGERAGDGGEMAMVDLGQCVELLSPKVSYLAARGLAIRFVDTGGSTRAFLAAIAEAAPRCDTVFVHAPAPELARLFSMRHGSATALASGADDAPCPIVLADDRPASVTHAYAAMKLLAQRADLAVFDLVLGAAPRSPRADRIVAKLSSCADAFFGGVVRRSARIDPAGEATEPPNAALRALVAARVDGAPHRPQTAIACPARIHRPNRHAFT